MSIASRKRYTKKRNYWYNVCKKKQRFKTSEQAVMALIDMKFHTGCTDLMHAYKCPNNHWHYGHPIKERRISNE